MLYSLSSRPKTQEELEGSKETALSLKATQYVRLLDKETGKVRVEKGEQGKLIPGPYGMHVCIYVCIYTHTTLIFYKHTHTHTHSHTTGHSETALN